VPTLPMFPLGSVLFPYMPLRLRVFEERYLVMLSRLVRSDAARFGVVLIERGRDVGGGEQRFGVGTVAEITQVGAQGGFVGLVARGGQRFAVERWLADAPHPWAEVRELPELTWDPGLAALMEDTERQVRRALAVASEFADNTWPADIELSDDPVAAAWQLAAIAPLGGLDQFELLRADSLEWLLTRIGELTADAAVAFEAPWPPEEDTPLD
jgi:uncharacterized protein